ncbi:MAG: type VI secretion system-associated protein TagF [Myxococcota bacterium]
MTSTTMFGKMPRAADFVRRDVTTPEVREFENWFHDAYTDLRGAGVRGLAQECHLVFPRRDDPKGAIAAVAIPSRDKIGREFPIVVATFLPPQVVGPRAAPLALGCGRFWEAAASVVRAHQDDEPDVLWEELSKIPAPTSAEMGDAGPRCDELLRNLGARQMEEACFPETDDRFYGYHTLRLAVQDAPEGRVLLCPTAGHPGYRAFWTDAIERSSRQRHGLSVLWLDGEDSPPAMMVTLGRVPSSLFRYGTGHGRESNALWPLTTKSAAARARSKSALAGKPWDDPTQHLDELALTIASMDV